MKRLYRNNQNGIALLIFVVMLLGVGGVVLIGFSQGLLNEVEAKKLEHNQRVLKEAKQALLQFAYNYPVTNSRGPGRLPCPDTDNDGIPNTPPDCSPALGRFPWRQQNLNLYDIRDADGQRLWYAASESFLTNVGATPNVINSDAFGTITVRDQSGNVIYDGSHPGDLAKSGVAAVIIAPGAITSRNGVPQDRSIANADDPFDATADTDPGIILASNYLDLVVGTEDNADFDQGDANDGFILGPVNSQSVNAVNDQMIIITAAEVIEAAEKAVLQTYREAINDYRNKVGGDLYPWLNDYTTTDLTVYHGDIGTRLGRLPSIFGNYFAPAPQPSHPTIFDLDMEVVGGLTINGFPVPMLDPGMISANASIVFDTNGDLIITPSVSGTTEVRYYWDEEAAPNGWAPCLPAGIPPTEQDCNQATLNPGVPDSSIVPNELVTRVVRVTYANNLAAGTPFTRPFADNAGIIPGTNPDYRAPTAANHASVYLEYSETTIDAIGVDYKYDNFYLASFDDVQLGSLNYRLGVTYYPELPEWPKVTENDWHNSVQVAYSGGYQPGAASSCTVGTDCITVNNFVGINDDKIAVLTLASEHDLTDNGAAGYQDDLDDIFDSENDHEHDTNPGSGDNDPNDGILDQDVFDLRAPNGNDKILVIR